MSEKALRRRDFLKVAFVSAGCYFVRAGQAFAQQPTEDPPGRYRFPQGVASADPLPDSVVLWTRVEAADGSIVPVSVTLEVATDETFEDVAVRRTLLVVAASDHTLRVVVSGLDADTPYYYRFLAGSDVSTPLGRTRTAPAPDADRPIRFAFVSCQHFEQGFYGAWRRMVNDDLNAPSEEKLDFVINLGDFIYESLIFGGSGEPTSGGATPLTYPDGRKRFVPAFPKSAAKRIGRGRFAETVDDYRHLYKTYLSDPDLQAARARWPFISTWDDHEFSNDSWQSHAIYTLEGTPSQRRKVSANQAWFEFIPAMLSRTQGAGMTDNPARDFVFVGVDDTRGSGDYSRDRNNRAAIGSMTIYRRLRFGRHVDLIVTDTRSYRSDHPVPEELATKIGPLERAYVAADLVRVFDAGSAYNDGNPPDTVDLAGSQVPNLRKNAPPGTVLGARQKRWWKETMKRSDATWRFWANSIPSLPLRIDFDDVSPEGIETILSTDAWDGYPGERSELMRYLLDEGIGNVVSLSGDHHMHFAGLIMDDFDGDDQRPAATEFSVAGISSTPTFKAISGRANLSAAIRNMTYVDPSEFGGEEGKVELLNLTFLQGVKASYTAASTGDLDRAKSMRNPAQNRHLRYMDSNANGYGLVTVMQDRSKISLITTEPAPQYAGASGSEILRSATFDVIASDGQTPPALEVPEMTGAPPFPMT